MTFQNYRSGIPILILCALQMILGPYVAELEHISNKNFPIMILEYIIFLQSDQNTS